MKKNGFTLTELLAVIVIIALLMVLIVPQAMNMAKKVKKKAFDTKVDLIKSAAKAYGEENITWVMEGKSWLESNSTAHYCTIPNDSTGVITYSESHDANGSYPCVKLTVDDLAEADEINYDIENGCDGYTTCDSDYYKKQVQDTDNNYIINKCNVYVYYKNKRVYAFFDKNTCKNKTETPSEGHEYAPLKKN